MLGCAVDRELVPEKSNPRFLDGLSFHWFVKAGTRALLRYAYGPASILASSGFCR
jgi:hypothetical protein